MEFKGTVGLWRLSSSECDCSNMFIQRKNLVSGWMKSAVEEETYFRPWQAPAVIALHVFNAEEWTRPYRR